MKSNDLDTQVLVAGAGIVGLAVARELALSGLDVMVVERQPAIGTEGSARNSEVIHAGLYYPPDSQKARHCVTGNKKLYQYCDSHDINYNRCGKLVVATTRSECETLEEILETAQSNGVHDLVQLSANQAKKLEPELFCTAALMSPSTGVIDSHGLIQSLLNDFENKGGTLGLCSELVHATVSDQNICAKIRGPTESILINTKWLINSAGLHSQNLAMNIDGLDKKYVPPTYLAKGIYFTVSGRPPFSQLIYPVPGGGGLGIHFTLDIGGQAKFGPDVQWVDQIDYSVDPSRLDEFVQAIQRYWPAANANNMHPGYAGIRPRIYGAKEAPADFLIQGPKTHKAPGLINLFGIESPGLTASLSLASEIVSLVAAEL